VAAEAREPFDIIVMDLMMPVMDGYEAMRRLRSAGCDLPILVVNANAFPSDRAAALAAGGSAFLAKPVGGDQLRAGMLELVGGLPAAAPGG
jgi:CheY-like chemotaxis protein